jgi:hypothetical protein
MEEEVIQRRLAYIGGWGWRWIDGLGRGNMGDIPTIGLGFVGFGVMEVP